jgi:hypothetical protein
LGSYTKPSCKSPFRTDSNPSWGIFETNNGWRFKDHGTDETGDEIALLANHLRLDQRNHFRLLLDVYQAAATKTGDCAAVDNPVNTHDSAEGVADPKPLPDRSGFAAGTNEQHEALATLRGLNLESIQWAVERGVLVFGSWQQFDCYGVTDSSGLIVEIRRLDGHNFPAAGSLSERKSHALKDSRKSWPVGLSEAAEATNILLVEGLPDFISAHELLLANPCKDSWAPVAMLSANAAISAEALTKFQGKSILIWFHSDDQHQGLNAALKWRDQLRELPNTTVGFFDTGKLAELADAPLKDLNDYLVAAKSGQPNHLPQPSTLLSNL